MNETRPTGILSQEQFEEQLKINIQLSEDRIKPRGHMWSTEIHRTFIGYQMNIFCTFSVRCASNEKRLRRRVNKLEFCQTNTLLNKQTVLPSQQVT